MPVAVRGRPLAALGFISIWLLVSCGGSSDAGPVATPTITPTATGAGFLATPTNTPIPPGVIQGATGACYHTPWPACAVPGTQLNVYRAMQLDRVVALHVTRPFESHWALDTADMQRVLRLLDRDVEVQRWGIDTPRGEQTRMTVFWAEGAGLPFLSGMTLDYAEFVLTDEVIANDPMQVQVGAPDDFLDALFGSFSDITPTPFPAVTPTVVAPGLVFLDHPEGELRWDGPDGRVTSQAEFHCGSADPAFGVPALVLVDDLISFTRGETVVRREGWHWTGYSHGDWQIWQGEDGRVAYLVHARQARIAFVYRDVPCE